MSTTEKHRNRLITLLKELLPNPVVEGEQTRVRLIEEAFHTAMWAG